MMINLSFFLEEDHSSSHSENSNDLFLSAASLSHLRLSLKRRPVPPPLRSEGRRKSRKLYPFCFRAALETSSKSDSQVSVSTQMSLCRSNSPLEYVFCS